MSVAPAISTLARATAARTFAWLLVLVLPICGQAKAEIKTEEPPDYFALTLEQLLEIRVTAQKREQNAQEVPLSVAIVRGEALDVLGSSGMDVRQLSARVPSLLIESSFGRTFPRFYLRGMGNTDFDLMSSQPVSLLMDEVVLENSLLKGFPLFDLDRVEVLRGPQGSLFGRNTPAGVIKYESRKPAKDLAVNASLGLGSFGSNNFDGMANLPLTDTLAVRVSALSQTRADWIDNKAPGFVQDDVLGGYDDKAGRVQLRYQPSNDLTLLLNYHVRTADADATVFMANIIEQGGNDLVSGFARDTVYQDAAARNRQRIDMHGGSVKLEQAFGLHTLFYIAGFESADIFSVGDIDGGYGACFLVQAPAVCSDAGAYGRLDNMGPGFVPRPSETGAAMPAHKQITHELRLASNELGALDYQVGLFLFDEELTIENFSFNTLTGGEQNGRSVQSMDSEAWAVFASADYDWSKNFSTVTGLRYSADSRDWRGELVQSPIGGAPFQAQTKVDDSQISWDISALYALDADKKLFARLAQGYRAPSIQGRNLLFSAQPTTADAETILSLEAGLKSEFMQRRARLNGSLFYYIGNGQQLTAVGGGSNVARLLNADETIGYGFELDSEWALAEKFFVRAGLSYNHTELRDADLAVGTCGNHCTVTDPRNADGRALINGNPLPQSPRWIANLSARYGWSVNNGELFVYSDWAYRSAINFFLYEVKEYTGAAMLEGGVRIGYAWGKAENHYEVALFGRNITDAVVLEGGVDFNNRSGYINEPRYFGLEFKARM